MPKKKAPKPTRLYELVVTFSGGKQQLVCHVEATDRQRLLRSLDDREKHGFHELGGPEGHECLVNTAHVSRLNVLDYLGGIQFEAEPALTDKQWAKKIEAREVSDETVILRVWLRGEPEPIVHQDIDHAEWCLARTCLDEDEKFIHFRDEDGEDLIYGADHIDAIEMIDPFYLKEEQIEKLLARYDDDGTEKTPTPTGIAATNGPGNSAPQSS